MKDLVKNINIIKDYFNCKKIVIDVFDDHYFITFKVIVDCNPYYIVTGFFDNGFDCRVERDEIVNGEMMRVNYIEFDNTNDLKTTFDKAIDEIIKKF